MSLTKRYLEEILDAIQKHRDAGKEVKEGDTLVVWVDTYKGRKRVRHHITEADLEWDKVFGSI